MIPALYKKLLNLYPRQFRKRLGGSMQQTFNDLYRNGNIDLFADFLCYRSSPKQPAGSLGNIFYYLWKELS